jgi:hypothetical protein
MSYRDIDEPLFSYRSDVDHQPTHMSFRELKHGEMTFTYVYDFYRGNIVSLAPYDAIIVEWTDPISAREVISKIRGHLDLRIFLKPIFFRKENGGSCGLPEQIVDGNLSRLEDLHLLTDTVNRLNDRISQMDLSKSKTYDEQIAFHFIAFHFSRDINQIAPFVDRNGIYYPVLSDSLRTDLHQKHFYTILERMEREGYVQGVFDQSTYVCSGCLGDHLLFREVCPGCQSAHLKSEEIVHHFRCAHVAPMSDFRHTDHSAGLECPKCQHDLKHIGVDYDKPATMHYCQSCQANFQHYSMMAKCTGCGHDQQVEHLIKKELKKYSLTDKAVNSVKSGKLYNKDFGPGTTLDETLPWHLFIKALDYEQSQHSSINNHLIILHFQDMAGIVRQIGEENRGKLFGEIIQIIKATQQPFDFRSVKYPRLFFTLMQTKLSDAEIIAQRIVFLINHLLYDNLRLKRVLLTSEVLPMDSQLIQAVLLENHTA